VNRVPRPASEARLLGDWSPAGLPLTEPATADIEVRASRQRRTTARRPREGTADDGPAARLPEDARQGKPSRRKFPSRLYVVVDELIGDRLTLSVSAWPQVDDRGRVRFNRSSGSWRIGVETPAFARFLFVHREPREHATRELRIGDVFAARRRPRANLDRFDETLADPADWMAAPVVDITAEAREVVKAAFYSAVCPVLRPEDSSRDAMIVAEAERRVRTEQEKDA